MVFKTSLDKLAQQYQIFSNGPHNQSSQEPHKEAPVMSTIDMGTVSYTAI